MGHDPNGEKLADQPGINGLRFVGSTSHVYYTSTVHKLFMRVRVDPITRAALGEPEMVASGFWYDDFCVDEERGLAYVTTHRENTLEAVWLEPSRNVSTEPAREGATSTGQVRHVVAGDPFDDRLVGPSSAAWGRQAGESGPGRLPDQRRRHQGAAAGRRRAAGQGAARHLRRDLTGAAATSRRKAHPHGSQPGLRHLRPVRGNAGRRDADRDEGRLRVHEGAARARARPAQDLARQPGAVQDHRADGRLLPGPLDADQGRDRDRHQSRQRALARVLRELTSTRRSAKGRATCRPTRWSA